ncbi:MAG: HEAT repeat domain-containing protein [Gemmataceae bacterium]
MISTRSLLVGIVLAGSWDLFAAPPPAGVVVAEGWQVEVVARSSAPARYAAVAPAADGTVFVAVAPPATSREPWSIRACRLRDGELTAFADVASAGSVTAMLAHDGWLFFSGGGGVERVRPTRAGGPFDRRETVLRGMGRVTGLCPAPDGGLAVAWCGARAEGSDGRRVELADGMWAVLRCRPDGSGLRVAATFRVEHLGPVGYDGLGRGFIGSPSGLLPFADGDALAGPDIQTAAIRAGRWTYGKVLAPGPSSNGELLLTPGSPKDVVQLVSPRRSGASMQFAEPHDILKCGPVGDVESIAAGLGGEVYVVTHSGTVLRLAMANARPADTLDLTALTSAGLTDTLKTCGEFERSGVAAELLRRGPMATDALRALLSDMDAPASARIVAASQLTDRGALADATSDGDAEVRRSAAESLAIISPPRDEATHAVLLNLLSDPEAFVRRAAALGIARVGAPTAGEVLVNAIRFDDVKDARLTEGYLRALDSCGAGGVAKLLELATSGSDADLAIAVRTFTKLRTPEAAAAIPRLLAHPHVTAEQRTELAKAMREIRPKP